MCVCVCTGWRFNFWKIINLSGWRAPKTTKCNSHFFYFIFVAIAAWYRRVLVSGNVCHRWRTRDTVSHLERMMHTMVSLRVCTSITPIPSSVANFIYLQYAVCTTTTACTTIYIQDSLHVHRSRWNGCENWRRKWHVRIRTRCARDSFIFIHYVRHSLAHEVCRASCSEIRGNTWLSAAHSIWHGDMASGVCSIWPVGRPAGLPKWRVRTCVAGAVTWRRLEIEVVYRWQSIRRKMSDKIKYARV